MQTLKQWTILALMATGWLAAQSNVTGQAILTLAEGPPACGGTCVTVDVLVDVTGLTGTGGDAGLNAFVLAFDVDRADLFASASRGGDLTGAWTFANTGRDLVAGSGRLVLVGAVADAAAPNAEYLVSSLILCGTPGDVTLTFVPGESSLGSRRVAGDGPGPIDIANPAPFTLPILDTFPLDFGTGLQNWMNLLPEYDLVDPVGPIDMLDLVQLVNCGAP